MDAVIELFRAVGGQDYVGEAVSQEQHALQAAKFASDAGADDETVLAALLHDVGHLLALRDAHVKQMEGGLGAKDHERLGASWLVTLGFPAKTAALVRRHVDAKRYLCHAKPAYLNKLSPASRATLEQQGGPMDAAEAAQFELDPLKDTIVLMRTWDEKAKLVEPAFEVPGLEAYREIAERAIEAHRAKRAEREYQFYTLSEEQMAQWREQGFLRLSDLLDEETKARVIAWVDEVQAWPETPGRHMSYYEKAAEGDELMLCRTENFLPYHAGLRELLAGPGPVTDALEQLLLEPAELFKEKVNYKLAGGGGFPAHQDAPAFTSFGQVNHLTLNVAVDAATPENGCLQVAPGHHRSGLFPQDPTHNGLSKEAEEGLDNWQDVLLDAGDVLIFSSWLPHRSGPNVSAAARRALYVTYNGRTDGSFREAYYELKRAEFPPKCEREPGRDYSEGAKVFNVATPIVS